MDMLPGIITYYWFTPEKKEISKFFVLSIVALTIMQCEDVFWWTRRKIIQIG